MFILLFYFIKHFNFGQSILFYFGSILIEHKSLNFFMFRNKFRSKKLDKKNNKIETRNKYNPSCRHSYHQEKKQKIKNKKYIIKWLKYFFCPN